MILNEKERAAIMDLQTQEKSCVEKYGKYAQQAKDPELKSLFETLQEKSRSITIHLDRYFPEQFRSVTATTPTEKIICRGHPMMR